MVNEILLLIAPCDNNDMYTEKFSSVAANIIKEKAITLGWTVLPLEGSQATKNKVNTILNNDENKVVFLIHYGHGDDDEMRGKKAKEVVDRSNIGKLKGRTISTVSCKTSKNLGRIAVNKKEVAAYMGYKKKYLAFNSDRSSILKEFIKASTVGNEEILKGNSLQDAYNSQIQAYNNAQMKFSQLYNDTKDIDFRIAAVAFESNLNTLEALGDNSAKLNHNG